jgi:hypothetical protein
MNILTCCLTINVFQLIGLRVNVTDIGLIKLIIKRQYLSLTSANGFTQAHIAGGLSGFSKHIPAIGTMAVCRIALIARAFVCAQCDCTALLSS